MNLGRKKIVVDTNVLLSAAIYPKSGAAQALAAAFLFCDLYRSASTSHELDTVLNRAKFDAYFTDAEFTRTMFLETYFEHAEKVEVTQESTDCTDPKDNQFLSLALTVGADIIVSGDKKHLLSMHPYKGISILSYQEFANLVVRDFPMLDD